MFLIKQFRAGKLVERFPDLYLVIELSDIFNLSIDNLLKENEEMVKTIDKNVKGKKLYKRLLIGVVTAVVLVTGFFLVFQNKNELVDRINPFMSYEISYATLPEKVTYNGGKEYVDNGKPQYPDPYKDIWAVTDAFGGGQRLTFKGGQAPEDKGYAMIRHKGIFVKQMTFVSWDTIPKSISNQMTKEYLDFNE
ncbi:XRE family transcriptional regulator [Vagococcus coleopterorum]|uniref:XRE family transcriptional regulator n=1 Tax=Vagococcus coleopterorum TaxID=2714946 RepID=UPI001EEB15C0|nr:XRE family transcriptional regulator [Vagococcus coleopterorum]